MGGGLYITNAYFSDTETSTGNVFQAGEIDLKIDHTLASYNGNDCRNDCSQTGPNLLVNPSFEANAVTHSTGWDIFPDGVATGWEVEWAAGQPTSYSGQDQPDPANLELHKSGTLPNTGEIPDSWLAQDGSQYAELDSDWNGHVGSLNGEPALVRISQQIPTVNGSTYKLSFYHSPRPGTGAGQNILKVYWNGNLVATIDPGAGGAGTNWTLHTYEVTAVSNSSQVAFEGGGTADSMGVFLDNTATAACSYVIAGGQCKLWELKDLEPGDFVWKFDDVKPGDYGQNVISYHVYSNNAWACTYLDKTDLENVIVDPEAAAGDVSDPLGELSQYLRFYVWHDDGDGIFETGETLIVDNTLNNISSWPLAEPPTPLIASNTKYIGIYWCFGGMTVTPDVGFSCNGAGNQNDSQTDIVDLTLEFYAEQERNNPNFSCQNLITPTPTEDPTNGAD